MDGKKHGQRHLDRIATSIEIVERWFGCFTCSESLFLTFIEQREKFLYEWVAGADNGCQTCTLVLQVVKSEGLACCGNKVQLWSTLRYIDIFTPCENEDTYRFHRRIKLFRDADERWDPSPKWLLSQVPHFPAHTMDKQSLAQVRSALQICDSSHDCLSESLPRLPSRLLDISSDRVRLIQCAQVNEGSRYIALSHCWQSHAICNTTKGNFSSLLNSVCWSSLPQTYRDAIQLSRELGIKYIWIDSLCIVQDDEEDWQQESILMGSIYRNAYATIGADLWDHYQGVPIDGCATKVRLHKTCMVSNSNNPESTWPIHTRAIDRNSSGDDTTHAAGPLCRRAWTLQERLLSPRFIWCRSTEIIVECLHSIVCSCSGENLTKQPPSWTKSGTIQKLEGAFSLRNEHWNGLKAMPLDSFLSTPFSTINWICLIQRYSSMHLTYQKDIFPALSGLASNFLQAERWRQVSRWYVGKRFALNVDVGTTCLRGPGTAS